MSSKKRSRINWDNDMVERLKTCYNKGMSPEEIRENEFPLMTRKKITEKMYRMRKRARLKAQKNPLVTQDRRSTSRFIDLHFCLMTRFHYENENRYFIMFIRDPSETINVETFNGNPHEKEIRWSRPPPETTIELGPQTDPTIFEATCSALSQPFSRSLVIGFAEPISHTFAVRIGDEFVLIEFTKCDKTGIMI